MLWMAQKECWKRREKRGMRCGEGEKEMAGRAGGFPAVCFFSFFHRDSCRDCFFPPWQLTAGEQHQYQAAGCENPVEECFHEPRTECDVNDSGGNTPICSMGSVLDECLGVRMKLICTWCGFHFISRRVSVGFIDCFSSNHKQIYTWKCTWKYAKNVRLWKIIPLLKCRRSHVSYCMLWKVWVWWSYWFYKQIRNMHFRNKMFPAIGKTRIIVPLIGFCSFPQKVWQKALK